MDKKRTTVSNSTVSIIHHHGSAYRRIRENVTSSPSLLRTVMDHLVPSCVLDSADDNDDVTLHQLSSTLQPHKKHNTQFPHNFCRVLNTSGVSPSTGSISSSIISDEGLQQQAFDVVCNAFAQILGIDDTASIKKDTDFFEKGGGSLQVRALQDYLSNDNGQDPKLRHNLEQ